MKKLWIMMKSPVPEETTIHEWITEKYNPMGLQMFGEKRFSAATSKKA